MSKKKQPVSPKKQPKHTMNHLTNGRAINRRRLVVGELPKQLTSVKNEGRTYRRKLEEATLETHGAISVTQGHLIDSASAATIHAGVCRWLLREKIATMGTGDILACSKAMVQAKESRDRAVKALKLDKAPEPVTLAKYLTLDAGEDAR